ncbi:type II secretion system protein [Chlamydiota bacterium]
MKNKKAFTFIELLIVLALISLLIGITVPITKTVFTRAKNNIAKTDIAKLENAIQLYEDKYGVFPAYFIGGTFQENEGLVYYLQSTGIIQFQKKQLIDIDADSFPEFIDPWGVPYWYENGSSSSWMNNDSFVDIASSGPDKCEGNWQLDSNLEGKINPLVDVNTDGRDDSSDNLNNWSIK